MNAVAVSSANLLGMVTGTMCQSEQGVSTSVAYDTCAYVLHVAKGWVQMTQFCENRLLLQYLCALCFSACLARIDCANRLVTHSHAELLHQGRSADMEMWMVCCFHRAARSRFQAMYAACLSKVPDQQGKQSAVASQPQCLHDCHQCNHHKTFFINTQSAVRTALRCGIL